MFRTMLKTGGAVAVSMGALLTAGSMNLAVLNGGPTGPGNLVIRAASGTTTTGAAPGHPSHHQAAPSTTATTRAQMLEARVRTTDATTTTGAGSTTTSSTGGGSGTTTTTQEPTTTTTRPPVNPQGARVFMVRAAGKVLVRWATQGRTIEATAIPNDGWTLPHSTKQGPDVTLRFQNGRQLVVWHAWVEAHQIKAWIKTYQLPA